tara:strand:+ start:3473 stop:3712 length:240 start_codon:yes stop_codon:yes gene_type:complete
MIYELTEERSYEAKIYVEADSFEDAVNKFILSNKRAEELTYSCEFPFKYKLLRYNIKTNQTHEHYPDTIEWIGYLANTM